jgi:hypothetical protein
MDSDKNPIGNIEQSANYSVPFSTHEKLEQIEKEIEDLKYRAKSPEEKTELEKSREEEYILKKKELEEKLGPLRNDSDAIIQKHIVSDVLDAAIADNKRLDQLNLERQKLINVGLAEDLLGALESCGVIPPQEGKEKLLDILTSPKIIDCDRGELVRLLGVNMEDKELLSRISANEELDYKFGRILRGQLVSSEYKELLLAHDVEFAGRDEFERSGANKIISYAGSEINDPEITGLGIENVKQIIREILNDEESSAGQGVFWNVLISKKMPYVLKAERHIEDERKTEYRERALFYYPAIRDAIGKRFLPRQAILRSESASRLYVLQEKQDLEKMIKVKSSSIDKLLEGSYAPQILEALKDKKNKQTLRDFIQGVENLYDQHKLMIDVEGDNLFFQVVDGNLEIKLIDYGCFEDRYKSRQDDIVKSQASIEKLKSLVND